MFEFVTIHISSLEQDTGMRFVLVCYPIYIYIYIYFQELKNNLFEFVNLIVLFAYYAWEWNLNVFCWIKLNQTSLHSYINSTKNSESLQTFESKINLSNWFFLEKECGVLLDLLCKIFFVLKLYVFFSNFDKEKK